MKHETTRSRFDQASAHYRTDSIKYRKLSKDTVSKGVMPAPSDVILDIGCGTGTQLIELSATVRKGIGIDLTPGMVKRAREEAQKGGCTNLEFYIGDFLAPERECDLSSMKINKVISNYALHHLQLEDKKRALEQMERLGGKGLEMIVIGDLMFFDHPKRYTDQYNLVGYGPGADQPCYAEELVDLFDKNAFAVKVEKLHPLVGVIKAVRRT